MDKTGRKKSIIQLQYFCTPVTILPQERNSKEKISESAKERRN